jgi:hypothetical protein
MISAPFSSLVMKVASWTIPVVSPRVDTKGYSPVGGFIKPDQGFGYFGN